MTWAAATTLRTATIRALTYCDLLKLQKESFDVVMASDSDFRTKMEFEIQKRQPTHPQLRSKPASEPQEAALEEEMLASRLCLPGVSDGVGGLGSVHMRRCQRERRAS